MKKELLSKIIKRIPTPIRKIIKVFYNPVIPVISKLDYGEDSYPEATALMCDKLIEVINKVDGDIIEFGCYKCGATIKLAKVLKEMKSNKKIYALDTFCGLPEPNKDKDNMPDVYKNSMGDINLNKIKVVFISAKSYDADIKKAYELGASYFFPKPFKWEVVYDKLEELLSEN